MGGERIIDIKDILKGSLGTEGSLSELINVPFYIKNVEFSETQNYGEVAVVEVEIDGEVKKYHTFSQVLIKQLRQLQKYLDGNTKILATIRRRKRYYTLDSPE